MTDFVEHYNIHDLVTLTVRRPRKMDWIPEISQPFRHFQVAAPIAAPDILLEVGDFEPELGDCYLVDHQYFVRPNYFYTADTYRSARWQVEIRGFEEGPTRIRIAYSYRSPKQWLAPGMFPQAILLKQLIAYHLSRRGYFLVHGAAAARDGAALLLFGRGGAYKTTLMMALLRQAAGWQLLGDDTVILGHGQVLSFPALSGFFAFRYRHLPTEDLSGFDRVRLLFFLARFQPGELPVAARGRPVGLVHCSVGARSRVALEAEDGPSNLARLIRVSAAEDHSDYNIGHTSIFPRYVEAYTYVFPGNALVRRWENAAALLAEEARGWGSCGLYLPESPDRAQFSEAVQRLEERFFGSAHGSG